MAEVPLVILLVKWLLKFIGYICALVALPFTLFSLLVKAFLSMHRQFDESPTFYFFMWIPRWIIVTGLLPFFVGEVAGLGYGISLHASTGTAAAIGAGFGVATIIGYLFTRFDSFLGSAVPKLEMTGSEGYFKALVTCQLDLIVAFCAIFVCIGIIRVPFTIWYLLNVGEKIRSQILFQFVMTFVDLLTLPFLLLTFLFFWRLPTLHRKITKATVGYEMKQLNESFSVRGHIIKQCLNGLFDIPVFSLSVLFLLTPWRIPVAINKMHDKKTLNKKRRSLYKQLGLMVIDFACVIMGAIVIVTLYRFYAMIHNFRLQDRAGHRRIAVCRQFGFIFVDIFTLFCSVFLLVTVYRLIPLYVGLAGKAWGFFPRLNNRHTDVSAQGYIIRHFGSFLLDIPFILMGLVVVVTLWRVIFLGKDLYNADTTNQRRKRTAKHFALLFLDILDLPFVLASLIILITLWRAVPFYKGIGITDKERTRNNRRLFVLKQFGLWLLDIPTFFAFLILMVTVYRAPATIRGLKLLFGKAPSAPTSSDPVLEDNPAPPQRAASWHVVVGVQFAGLLLDIPFPLLLVLTLWRLPWCVRRIISECDTAAEKRIMILRFLWGTLKDIPCVLIFLFIVLCAWRIPSLINLFKTYNRGDSEHKLLLKLFGRTIADIPFVLMGLFAIACLWRGIFLIRAFFQEERTDKQNRALAAQYFLAVLGDVTVVLMGAIILATGAWRLPSLVFFCKYYFYADRWDDNFRWRHLVTIQLSMIRTIGLIFLDYFTIMQLIVIFIGIIHIPSLFVRSHKVTYIRRNGGTDNAKYAGTNSMGDYRTCVQSAREEEEPTAPLSLSFYRTLIMGEFHDSLRHLPHLFLIPVKIAGIVFLPVHAYLAFRVHKVAVYKELHNVLAYVPASPVVEVENGTLYAYTVDPPPSTPPPPPPLPSSTTKETDSSSSSESEGTPALKRRSKKLAASDSSEPLNVRSSKDYGSTHTTTDAKEKSEKEEKEEKEETEGEPNTTTSGNNNNEETKEGYEEIAGDKEKGKEGEGEGEGEGKEGEGEKAVNVSVENDKNNLIGAEKEKKKKKKKDGAEKSKPVTKNYQELVNSPSAAKVEKRDDFSEIVEDPVTRNNTIQNATIPARAPSNPRSKNNNNVAKYSSTNNRQMSPQEILDAQQRIADYNEKHKSNYFSFLQYPLVWLHAVSKPRMNFWGMDQFFILNLVSLFVVVPNEIAMVVLMLNMGLIFLLTLGSPLWTGVRRRNKWHELGEAQGFMVPLEIVLLIIQTTLFPVFLFIQFLLLFFPVLIISASHFPAPHKWPTFTYFWHSFFTSRAYWHRYRDFQWWFWIIEAYWTVIFVATLHLTFIYGRKTMPLFNPVRAYYWLFKRVFTGRVWGFYKLLLKIPTRWCFRHRKSLGCLGELLMFPLFLAWVGWPVIIPPLTNYFVFIASGPIVLFLIFKGYFLVKENWASSQPVVPDVPALQLHSVHVDLPETGGLVFTLRGTKDPRFSITQAKWIFEGKEFWTTLGDVFGHGMVSGAKMTLHPVDLCPNLMDPNDLAAGKVEFEMNIRAGVAGTSRPMKHSTVLKKLNLIIKSGDPTFKMVFQHGVNKFGWKKAGTLCSFDLKLSDILRAAETKESLVAAPPHFELHIPEAPPIRPIEPKPRYSPPAKRRLEIEDESNHNEATSENGGSSGEISDEEVPDVKKDEAKKEKEDVQQKGRGTEEEERKMQLVQMMGISYDEASAAYIMFDGDVERAANYLLTVKRD